jgi:hypothetical protein
MGNKFWNANLNGSRAERNRESSCAHVVRVLRETMKFQREGSRREQFKLNRRVGLPQWKTTERHSPWLLHIQVVEASSTNSSNNGRNNKLGGEDSRELVPSGFAKAANLLTSGLVNERVVPSYGPPGLGLQPSIFLHAFFESLHACSALQTMRLLTHFLLPLKTTVELSSF